MLVQVRALVRRLLRARLLLAVKRRKWPRCVKTRRVAGPACNSLPDAGQRVMPVLAWGYNLSCKRKLRSYRSNSLVPPSDAMRCAATRSCRVVLSWVLALRPMRFPRCRRSLRT